MPVARLHVLCGLPGSGKTTFSKRLITATRAIRLANDEWMLELFGPDLPELRFRPAAQSIERLQWDLAEQLLSRGVDVIWDYGAWSRAERAQLLKRCQRAGAEFRLYDVRCDFEEAVRRVLRRKEEHPASQLSINREAMLAFRAKYEAPSPDEGFAIVVVDGQ